MAKRMNDMQSNTQRRGQREEGEVNIDYVPGKEKQGDNEDEGEYVDFEEIE
jgi:hypothetical protein